MANIATFEYDVYGNFEIDTNDVVLHSGDFETSDEFLDTKRLESALREEGVTHIIDPELSPDMVTIDEYFASSK